MITLDITTVLLVFFMLSTLFFAFEIYKLKNKLRVQKNEFEYDKIRKREEYDSLLEMEQNRFFKENDMLKELHQKEIEGLKNLHESQLSELEILAEQKLNKTNEAYEKAFNQAEKELEIYQKYILNINTAIHLADSKLTELDSRGTFKSDDEIGFFFKAVTDIQNILNEFKVEIQKA